MSIFKTPTLTCTVCNRENIKFAAAKCPGCLADIAYEVENDINIQSVSMSLGLIKFVRYLFIGILILLVLILVPNLQSGEFDGMEIMAALMGLNILCILGMYWLSYFVVNKFKSRSAITFVKE